MKEKDTYTAKYSPKNEELPGKHRTNRRKLLKSASVVGVAAGSMPAAWTRPVIKKTILPAHAETTCAGNIQVGMNFFNDAGAVPSPCATNDFNSGTSEISCNYNFNQSIGADVSIDPPAAVTLEVDWTCQRVF